MDEDENMTKVNVGKLAEFAPGTMKGVSINERMVLVVNLEGKLYAMQGICSHMGGHLWEGKLMGNVVKCLRHGSEFDVRTGKNLKGPWIPFGKAHDLPAYPVSVEADGVFVEMP